MDERFAGSVALLRRAAPYIAACWVASSAALTQGLQSPTGAVTLNEAIGLALKNYPAIRERQARAQAADAGIRVARTAYLPRLDALWQGNRATRNNVFGMLLPQSVVPQISGPVLGTTSYNSVWGSAGGVFLS